MGICPVMSRPHAPALEMLQKEADCLQFYEDERGLYVDGIFMCPHDRSCEAWVDPTYYCKKHATCEDVDVGPCGDTCSSRLNAENTPGYCKLLKKVK
jgi:hypothetical protein